MEIDAGDERVSRALEKARQLPDPSECAEERYVLIKAWGAGFWSDVLHLLAGLLLAEITGRVPVVHWGRHSLFRRDPEKDSFTCFFKPVSDITLEDLKTERIDSIYPGKWALDNLREENLHKWEGPCSRMGGTLFLNRPETLTVLDFYVSLEELYPFIPETHAMYGCSREDVIHYLAEKYLHPNEDFLSEARAFCDRHGLDQDAVAAHFRGAYKELETWDYDKTGFRFILDELDRQPEDRKIFVMTDDERCVDMVRERYGDRVAVTDCQRATNDQGIHIFSKDRYNLGREIMIDTYIALACGHFVGGARSNVAFMISNLKQWPENACRICYPTHHLSNNISIYFVINPSLKVGRVCSEIPPGTIEDAISSLARADVHKTPFEEAIDYGNPDCIEQCLARVEARLSVGDYREAAIRLQILYHVHLETMAGTEDKGLFLRLLRVLAMLRRQTGSGHLDLSALKEKLNALADPERDIKVRGLLNDLIPDYEQGRLSEAGEQIWQILNDFLPEIAAPMSPDIRALLVSMCEQASRTQLVDIVREIDALAAP